MVNWVLFVMFYLYGRLIIVSSLQIHTLFNRMNHLESTFLFLLQNKVHRFFCRFCALFSFIRTLSRRMYWLIQMLIIFPCFYMPLYHYNTRFACVDEFCSLRGPHCGNQFYLLHLSVHEHESIRERKFSEYSVLFWSVNGSLPSTLEAYTDVTQEVTEITAQ